MVRISPALAAIAGAFVRLPASAAFPRRGAAEFAAIIVGIVRFPIVVITHWRSPPESESASLCGLQKRADTPLCSDATFGHLEIFGLFLNADVAATFTQGGNRRCAAAGGEVQDDLASSSV